MAYFAIVDIDELTYPHIQPDLTTLIVEVGDSSLQLLIRSHSLIHSYSEHYPVPEIVHGFACRCYR